NERNKISSQATVRLAALDTCKCEEPSRKTARNHHIAFLKTKKEPLSHFIIFMSRALNRYRVDRGWSMKLAPTLPRAAPTDRCTSSINFFDNIDQWRPLFERSALGVAMIDSGFHFLVA